MNIASPASLKTHVKAVQKPSKMPIVQALVVVACLILIELICYGPIVRHAGFYLDDWSTLSVLHFGPKPLLERLLYYFLADPRVTIRPIEVLYFGFLYSAFGLQPLGYHLVNGVLEIICSWLLYLAVALYAGDRRLAFVAALMLLLYPIHDSTHYWVLASSVTFSLATYLASLWLCIKGVKEHKSDCLGWSVGAFALSVFNYESFLPLFLVNAFCAFTLLGKSLPYKGAILAVLKNVLAPCLVVVASLWLYDRILLPMFGQTFTHPIALDPAIMARTVIEGCKISSPLYSFPFFWEQAQQRLSAGMSVYDWGELVMVSGLTALTLFMLPDNEGDRKYLKLAGLGVLIVVLSFTIFGLNSEYQPTLTSIVNRVNAGAAVGMSLIFAVLCGFMASWVGKVFKAGRLEICLLSLLTAALSVYFIVSNWAQAKPWNLSWYTQKHIMSMVKRNEHKLHAGDSLILANCPRYVMWSPVFDGVWDFEPMVRLTLNRTDIDAGVTSERLVMASACMRDISMGYTCAIYPFKRMFILIPDVKDLIEVRSASGFIDTIEHHGMLFGLNRSAIARWRQQLEIANSRNSR